MMLVDIDQTTSDELMSFRHKFAAYNINDLIVELIADYERNEEYIDAVQRAGCL